MKYFFLVVALTISACVYADNVEKEYKKLVCQYDVADEAKRVEANHPQQFWEAMIDNNELFKQSMQPIMKAKGSGKVALEKLMAIPRFDAQYDNRVVDYLQGFCDTLLIDMGIPNLNLNCSLHIVYSDEVNAYTLLTEKGFAMCITSELFAHKGITYDMLMGYVAHEFVHGALMHHVRQLYKDERERRKAKVAAGFATAAEAISAGADAYASSMAGKEYDSSIHDQNIENIKQEMVDQQLRKSFKFSREEEYEADLVAFRFMQNLGKGEEFINGLRLLGTRYDNLYSEYSDHPTTGARIEFIKYVDQNPELGNTENEKIRKKAASENE
jgi:predicted Zn-dependent protease